MSRLTRDGTAEPISRGQVLRRKRGQIRQPYPVDLNSAIVLTMRTTTLLGGEVPGPAVPHSQLICDIEPLDRSAPGRNPGGMLCSLLCVSGLGVPSSARRYGQSKSSLRASPSRVGQGEC